jgi:hypothetical protein
MSSEEQTSNQLGDETSASSHAIHRNGDRAHAFAGRIIYVSSEPDGRRAVHVAVPAPAQIKDSTVRACQVGSTAVTTTARQARERAGVVVERSKPYSKHIGAAVAGAIIVLLLITLGRGRAHSSVG